LVIADLPEEVGADGDVVVWPTHSAGVFRSFSEAVSAQVVARLLPEPVAVTSPAAGVPGFVCGPTLRD